MPSYLGTVAHLSMYCSYHNAGIWHQKQYVTKNRLTSRFLLDVLVRIFSNIPYPASIITCLHSSRSTLGLLVASPMYLFPGRFCMSSPSFSPSSLLFSLLHMMQYLCSPALSDPTITLSEILGLASFEYSPIADTALKHALIDLLRFAAWNLLLGLLSLNNV